MLIKPCITKYIQGNLEHTICFPYAYGSSSHLSFHSNSLSICILYPDLRPSWSFQYCCLSHTTGNAAGGLCIKIGRLFIMTKVYNFSDLILYDCTYTVCRLISHIIYTSSLVDCVVTVAYYYYRYILHVLLRGSVILFICTIGQHKTWPCFTACIIIWWCIVHTTTLCTVH